MFSLKLARGIFLLKKDDDKLHTHNLVVNRLGAMVIIPREEVLAQFCWLE